MTRRERMERRAERRLEWATSRDRKSEAGFDRAQQIADQIPMGQPILVGHHSEKRHRRAIDRMDSGMRAGVKSADMAERHRSKADGIQRQLDASIFSDDADAVKALEVRIAEREARAEKIKVYNKSCRAAAKAGEEFGDLSLLNEDQRKSLLSTLKVCPYQIGKGGAMPSYVLSNLRGRITADKKRIESIHIRAERAQKADDAGGTLIDRSGEYCTITFSEKPEREVINALKDAGFYWSGGRWNGLTENIPECVDEATA